MKEDRNHYDECPEVGVNSPVDTYMHSLKLMRPTTSRIYIVRPYIDRGHFPCHMFL